MAGSLSQLKWRVSLRPDAGVSDDGLVCHHPILRLLKSVMALRSKYVDATYYKDIIANSEVGYLTQLPYRPGVKNKFSQIIKNKKELNLKAMRSFLENAPTS